MSVHKTPNGTYRVKYTKPNGQDGSKNFKRKKEADAFDREQIDRRWGYRSPDAVDMDKRRMAFELFYDTFMRRFTGKAVTREGYRKRWAPKVAKPSKHHLVRWADWPISEVNDREAVAEWHQEMRAAGTTAASMYRAHDMLTSLMSKAAEWGYVDRMKIGGMEPDYVPASTGGVWLPDKIERVRGTLLARVASPPKGNNAGGGVHGVGGKERYRALRSRDATLISLLGYTAMRAGEALALRWDQLLDGRRIVSAVEIVAHRPHHEDDDEAGTKTTRGRHNGRRTVPLPEWVRADVMAYWMRSGQPHEGYVFLTAAGKPFDLPGDWSNWIRAIWHPLLNSAGIESAPPKHLRMSCISTWLRAGVPLDVAARRAGHSIQTCERTYRHECEVRELSDFEALDIPAAVEKARSDLPVFFPITAVGG